MDFSVTVTCESPSTNDAILKYSTLHPHLTNLPPPPSVMEVPFLATQTNVNAKHYLFVFVYRYKGKLKRCSSKTSSHELEQKLKSVIENGTMDTLKLAIECARIKIAN